MPKRREYLDPAAKIIDVFGGPTRVAEIVHRHRSQVHRWRLPRERGGLDGRIPGKLQKQLLTEAKARNLPIQPADLIA